jgi:hypothetical protein
MHGYDRSARDDTSYPSTNILSISLLYYGSSLFKYNHFISFLGDLWEKNMEVLYEDFIFYPTPSPYNEGQSLLGSIYPKIQREKEMEGNNDGNW